MRRMWNAIRKFCREADMLLFCLCIAASLFGLVLVFSAVQTSAHPLRYIAVQSAAMMIGAVLFILLSVLDIYDLSDYWKLLLAFNLLFAASTFFFGKVINGNKSWIVPPVIGISVQPAEVVKVSFSAPEFLHSHLSESFLKQEHLFLETYPCLPAFLGFFPCP